MPQSPKPSPPDTVQSAPGVSPAATQTTAVTRHVQAAITQMNTVAGSVGYAVALNNLRQNVAEAAPLVAKLYFATPAPAYVERWSLVKVLADLHHPSALSQLDTIVNMPLPAAQGDGAERTLSEETMIRTTAAEGIAQQAGAGDSGALALLLKNCRNPVFSVKQASVQAYLALGGPQARATLESQLSPGERFVLDIRPISAAEMAQPQAGAVKPRPAANEIPAPPVQGGGAAKPPTGDAPVRGSK